MARTPQIVGLSPRWKIQDIADYLDTSRFVLLFSLPDSDGVQTLMTTPHYLDVTPLYPFVGPHSVSRLTVGATPNTRRLPLTPSLASKFPSLRSNQRTKSDFYIRVLGSFGKPTKPAYRLARLLRPQFNLLRPAWATRSTTHAFDILGRSMSILSQRPATKGRGWLAVVLVTLHAGGSYALWSQLFSLLPTNAAVDLLSEVAASPHSTPSGSMGAQGAVDFSYWQALGVIVRLWRLSPPQPSLPHGVGLVYNRYIVSSAERMFGAPVMMRVMPYHLGSSGLLRDHDAIVKLVYPALRRFHRRVFYKDWAMVFMAALKQRNAAMLLRWLVRLMTRIKPAQHKRFLTLLDTFFLHITNARPSVTSHLGVSFIVNGKISVSGNAKTRSRRLGAGKRSLTTKGLSLRFAQRQVVTPTGVLGIKCFITY